MSASPRLALPEELAAAIEYGYQRGQADERYGRGYRASLAVENWSQEQADAAILAEARRQTTSDPPTRKDR